MNENFDPEEMRELLRLNAWLNRNDYMRDRYAPPSIGERMEWRLQNREDERRHPEWYPLLRGGK